MIRLWFELVSFIREEISINMPEVNQERAVALSKVSAKMQMTARLCRSVSNMVRVPGDKISQQIHIKCCPC